MLETLLNHIVPNKRLHSRWLQTLSALELSGAKKIASYIPRELNRGLLSWEEEQEILQHAAEEFRHAFFFHRQIQKLESPIQNTPLFCKGISAHYLTLLELNIIRDLRGLNYQALKKGAYLLTTWAIEKRALEVYETYEELLRKFESPISIRSILREENGHLFQIEKEIEKESLLLHATEKARSSETKIYTKFLEALKTELSI